MGGLAKSSGMFIILLESTLKSKSEKEFPWTNMPMFFLKKDLCMHLCMSVHACVDTYMPRG